MNALTRVKLALGIVGVALFLWGTRADDATTRWIGVVALAVAVAMRFFRTGTR